VSGRRLRLSLTIGLGVYGAWLARTRHYSWIDSLDTAIHETGHLLFGFWGRVAELRRRYGVSAIGTVGVRGLLRPAEERPRRIDDALVSGTELLEHLGLPGRREIPGAPAGRRR
jgi:hypothetical protein